MEENTQQSASQTPQKSNNLMMYIVVVIVIILAIGGGWYAYKKMKHNTPQPAMQMQPTQPAMKEDNSMKATEAPTMPMGSPSAMDKMDANMQKVMVSGFSFGFNPKTITVKKGQKVQITFKSTGGMHNFAIDEFKVKSVTVGTGETTTVEFTPDKTGTFQYYCAIGNHRSMGMVGTLTVE